MSSDKGRAVGRDVNVLQDLRNHGDSPHNPYHNYKSMAEDVEGFIEEHNLHDPTLIGHSMLVLLP